MPKTQKTVKKFEKRFASNVTKSFSSFFKSVGGLFVKLFRIFDRKLTIMIVPHSQNKVINFQTNVFALIFGEFAIFLYRVPARFYNKISGSGDVSLTPAFIIELRIIA